MGQPILQEVILETTTCCQCGIVFAMPDYLMKNRREKGGDFYCPNGHSLVYKQTEVMRLREMLSEANLRNTTLVDKLTKSEKENKRIIKRSKHGVCPCCNRTFSQLARHMKSKHPTYGK